MRQTILAVLSLSAIAALLTGCGGDMVLLNSKGPVAQGQSDLMMTAIYLMLLVVIPSVVMALWFGWKYRASNKDADYKPTWAHSTAIEIVVWGIPVIIIGILAWLTWWGSHKYDPYRPLESDKAPVNIQVIAEQFKWIFIYPDLNIATVNEIRFPEKTPVALKITSNFTMNSFFIPALGGQIYAMAGMQTHLNLLADGTSPAEGYRGFSSNYSGYGFSQMRFRAHSVTDAQFAEWVAARQPVRLAKVSGRLRVAGGLRFLPSLVGGQRAAFGQWPANQGQKPHPGGRVVHRSWCWLCLRRPPTNGHFGLSGQRLAGLRYLHEFSQ